MGFVPVAIGGLGLLIGSFLNVVIARVPEGVSVVRPSSRCAGCATAISSRDNVPVISWLVLRGRARCCGAGISSRYPVVELLTAIAFAAVTAWFISRTGTPGWPLGDRGLPDPAAVLALVGLLGFAALGIALAAIDIDTRRLPFVLVAPAVFIAPLLLGGAAILAGNPTAAVRMLIGGAGLWGLYRLLHLIYPAGMGYGDVRLSALIGQYLAWFGYGQLIVGAFSAFLLGALGGVAVMALRGAGLKTAIPYGPYMLLGAWIGIVWGGPLAAAYLRMVGL